VGIETCSRAGAAISEERAKDHTGSDQKKCSNISAESMAYLRSKSGGTLEAADVQLQVLGTTIQIPHTQKTGLTGNVAHPNRM